MNRYLAAAVAVLTLLSMAPASSQAGGRTITLETSRNPVTYSSGFVLRGRVTVEGGGSKQCVSGVEVSIVRDFFDDLPNHYLEVARVTTSDGGRFQLGLRADNSASYRAEVRDVPLGCGAARSQLLHVRSRLDVSLSPTTASAGRGEVVRLVAKVRPICEDVVYLAEFIDGRFRRVASARPNDLCVAVFRHRVDHDTVLRARHSRVASPAYLLLGNRSALTAISVRG